VTAESIAAAFAPEEAADLAAAGRSDAALLEAA
jgi:hypothetical protein